MKKKIIIAISALLLIVLSIIGTLLFVDWREEQEAIRQAEIAAELKARQEAEEKARLEAEEKAREEARIASIKAELKRNKNRLEHDLDKLNKAQQFTTSPNFKVNVWDCENYYQADYFTALVNYQILEYIHPYDRLYCLIYYLYNSDREKVSIFENSIALLKKMGTRFVAVRTDELKLFVNGERTPLMQAYYGESIRVDIILNEPIENFDPKDYGLTINSLELKPRRNTKFHKSIEVAEKFRKLLLESNEKLIKETQDKIKTIEQELSKYPSTK